MLSYHVSYCTKSSLKFLLLVRTFISENVFGLCVLSTQCSHGDQCFLLPYGLDLHGDFFRSKVIFHLLVALHFLSLFLSCLLSSFL